jgi:hypothetical protein
MPENNFISLEFSHFSSIDERYEIQQRAVEIYRALIRDGSSPKIAKEKVEQLYSDGWKQRDLNESTTRYSVFGDLL